MKPRALDLFSGVGGLSQGMHDAGFKTVVAFEIDAIASKAYKRNHKNTKVFTGDIRDVSIAEVRRQLGGTPLHLLAGCPPCQGFSSLRRLNRSKSIRDERNSLINEYVRFVRGLRPYTIMMENVPGLTKYYLFKKAVRDLKKLGYAVDYRVVNVKDYGVPQSRKRLVLIGSRLGEIKVPEKSRMGKRTVRDTIGHLKRPAISHDFLHKVFPEHTEEVMDRIRRVPKNGGSRKDLPKRFTLKCHEPGEVGFHDIYGRLRWDDYSSTISGGCLNPSKGRFLHPRQNRNISAREAALLQTFPARYKFPKEASRGDLALLIGNALPPKFSYFQSRNIKEHLKSHLG